ncbi:MAG: aminoacyl-tRNA hydrolase [Gammaproteobacteria bacterium]|nr:aminoacyl-tRNA hydrolase [Gammaproteobacteria bacterium]
MQSNIQLIVGLGNPGIEYEKTRHNIGALFVKKLLNSFSVPELSLEKKFNGLFAKATLFDHACYFLLPMSFMNCSGSPVLATMHFYKIPVESILVVHDDLDLPIGSVRFKKNGGDGGHNGIKDIIRCLGSKDFFRLRFGIGRPESREEITSYVLKKPSPEEKKAITKSIDKSIALFPEILSGHLDKVMQELHQKE